jgi:hypothetical protein
MANNAQTGNRAGDCYNAAGYRNSSDGLFLNREVTGGTGILKGNKH